MKLHVVAQFALVSALVLAPLTQASAQVTTSPGDASARVYNWCMKRPDGTPGECGCVAGFYAGVTEDDAFRIIARLVEHLEFDGTFKDEEALFAAVREEATGQSISNERLTEIMEDFLAFDEIGIKADTICVPLKGDVASAGE